MLSFLIYNGKVAVALLVFYLFYRFLLKKETFHKFNRIVLVGTAALSFLLPLCIITIRKPVEMGYVGLPEISGVMTVATTAYEPWWHTLLTIIFFVGLAFVLLRVLISILSIMRIIRQGKVVREEDGCKVIVVERVIDPFSWMQYIVMSKKDWESPHEPIIAHEMAHIGYRHSAELLLVDVLSALQWFNPAIWMLRADLQELHEYQADDAVLQSGANLKEYQYLLIKKAVSKSGYSVANSFNHSILKNRITMMSKSKSPLKRGLRVLYMLPLVCLALGLQAQTVYIPMDKVNEKEGNTTQTEIKINPDGAKPLYILRQVWGEEKEITFEEVNQIDRSRISSIEVLKYTTAKEKYGERGANGVIVITLKSQQELDEIVVVSYREKTDKPIRRHIVQPDTMPTFEGGDMNGFVAWLNRQIEVPKDCNHSGNMKVGFVVDENGDVKDIQILESVCDELDAMMLSLVAKSPKWGPATVKGKPVPQFLTIPITFQKR